MALAGSVRNAPAGVKGKQSPAATRVAGVDHDDNVTHVDALGGQVIWLAPTLADASLGSPV